MKMTGAAEFVRSTLLDALPEGVPPSFRTIRSARYEGHGHRRRAIGLLTMFDGNPATVECWQSGPCRAHRFIELTGGSVSWEGDRWVRCAETGDIMPELPLFYMPAGRADLTEETGGGE